MLLSAADFDAEQQYLREKHKMRNSAFHGYGVVWGFDVSILKGAIRVSPGLALSCGGDEIVVDERLAVPLPETRSRAT